MVIAINLTAIILASISIVISLAALGVCLGMRWSTHRVDFKPLEAYDPLKQEEDFGSFSEPDTTLVDKAMGLSREGVKKKKKKEEDPLDSLLESNNF
jgi:hypothetical protein